MQVTIRKATPKKTQEGETYWTYSVEDTKGTIIELGRSKYCKDMIAEGMTYEVELYKGEKRSYINSAILIDSTSPETTPAGYKKPQEPKEVEAKKTPINWEARNSDIRYQACIKASASFHAHRTESTIKDVIRDAKIIIRDYTKPLEEETEAF